MNNFTPEEKKIMLGVADKAIQYGLDLQQLLPINPADFPEKLQEAGASFVTLTIAGNLRGCIGSLQAHQPLIVDIAKNAYAAAFCDPRFLPLTTEEYPRIIKHISVLTKPVPMSFINEKDLCRQLCCGVDGLILTDCGYCGTFLPSVWESLPTPELFVKHLKLKAGLPENHWSDTIKIEKYTTEIIEDELK